MMEATDLVVVLGWTLLVGLLFLGVLGIAACLGGYEAREDNRIDAARAANERVRWSS